MTKEEYTNKINELKTQKRALDAQISQVNKEFKESSVRELEEQGITTGTKVLVKTKTWKGDEVDIETYFFGLCLEWGEVRHVFHKIKKDGTMSQINQYIEGRIISINKI